MKGKCVIFVLLSVLFVISGMYASDGATAGETQTDSQINTSTVEVMEVVVTARRVPESLAEMTHSADIIKKSDIINSGASSVPEILDSIPGCSISRYGLFSGISNVSLRGKSSTQTLVLLDGIPLNDLMTGGYDINNINLLSIDRIEVVKGGISSVYGPGAMGGVINFISGDSDKEWVKASSRYGSFGYQKNQISSCHTISDFNYFVMGAEEKADGYRVNSDYHKQTLNSKLKYRVGAFDAALTGNYLNYTQSVPGSITYPSLLAKQYDEEFNLGINGNYSADLISGSAGGFFKSSDFKYKDTDPLYPSNSRHKVNESQGNIMAVYDNKDNISAACGAEFNLKKMDSTDVGKKDMQNTAFFSNAVYLPVRALVLNAGIRQDINSVYNNMTSGNVGLKYLMDNNVEMHATLENAYSAPTFGQLYWLNDGWMCGNKDLKTEQSVSYEIGIAQKNGKFKQSYVWFNRNVRDMIQYVTDPVTYFGTYVNLNKVKIMGLEAEAEYSPFDFISLNAGYTYTNAVDPDTNLKINYIPEGKLTGRISFTPVKGTCLAVDGEYVDARTDSSGSRLKEYYLIAMNISHELNKNTRIFLNAENILDNKEYAIVSGYPMPGRTVNAGMEVKF